MENETIVSKFDYKLSPAENVQTAFEFISDNYHIAEEQQDRLKEKLRILFVKFKQRIVNESYKKDRFEAKFSSWLKSKFAVEEFIEEENINDSTTTSSASKRGRPRKSFLELSERSKRRVIDNETLDPKVDSIEKALLMTRRVAYNRHDNNLVKIVGQLLKNQENFAKMFVKLTDECEIMTLEEAFEAFICNNFSKATYQRLHRYNPARFPPYGTIEKAKMICAPTGIEESPSKIKVQLQALMQHTAERIVKIVEKKLIEHLDANDLELISLVLLSSWGMDGSTGYQQFSQKLPEGSTDDSDVFASTMTPIQLFMHSDRKHLFWMNPMPQSIRFCRPIFLQFVKECKELILATKRDMEKEMSELSVIEIELSNGKSVIVDFVFVLSAIDQKVLTYITGTSSMQNCPICGATPNMMTSSEKLEEGFLPNEESLNYGISPLHAWIRFFECLLHISYRLDIKQWKVTKTLKDTYKTRKELVLKNLYDNFGVRVDQPKAGGGTTTTGNRCRKVFSNPKLLSESLGIDEELIVRFRNILITINCQDPVNPEKVDVYCKDTYRRYLELYSWYKMPSSVHKVLAHAGDIIIHSPAPLGVLAEEAAESQHKKLKNIQSHHARRRSRADNLHDVFIRALNESDPFVSTIWVSNRRDERSSKDYPDVVKDFLIFNDVDNASDNNILEDLLNDLELVDEDFIEDDIVESDIETD